MVEKSNKRNKLDINNSLIFIENEKKEEEEEIDIKTPHIFKSRKCKTCKIMRPPKSSHCRICDNCILELDHHCFYISNCVGIRNHKNFYLFLLFGTLVSILVHISCLYHFIYVIFLFNFEITKNMFFNYKIYVLFFDLDSKFYYFLYSELFLYFYYYY